MTHTFACPTCQRRVQVRYGVQPHGDVYLCPGCGARYWLQTERHWVMLMPLPQEEPPHA